MSFAINPLTGQNLEPPIDLFFIAGQSNASGMGESSTSEIVPPTYGYEAQANLLFIKDPVSNANTGSAWPAFCNRYYLLTKRVAAVIGSAFPGSGQYHQADVGYGNWEVNSPSGIPLLEAVLTQNKAILDGFRSRNRPVNFRGIIWCQGANDGDQIAVGAETIVQYKTAFVNMIARWREVFPNAPFYISRIGTRGNATSDVPYKAVRDAQEEVVLEDDNNFMVFRGAIAYPDEGRLQNDFVHYTQEGYKVMGEAIAISINNLIPK